MKEKFKSGYVALIGRTNVGKSTFLNSILNFKVSIVSNKPQTTRKQILGIKTTKKGQIIFFDSPGIHKPHFKLNERMMKDVYNSLQDADIILYLIEINDKREDEFVLSMLNDIKKPVFLLINKIDKFSKGKALERIDYFKDKYKWSEIIPISALRGDNLELVEELIYKYLPEGPLFYDEEEFTLQSEKFYISEMIREKLLLLTREELPFTTTVKVEEIKDKGKLFYIRADIFVETKSQKKIIVGHQGKLIKEIGKKSREELEEYFDKKVFLELYVKVVPNWRNSANILKDIFN